MIQKLPEKRGRELEELLAEQEARTKVIDFDEVMKEAWDLRNSVAFHVAGFGLEGEDSLVAGILLAEQVLKQGLLSKQIRDRAGVVAGAFGFNTKNPMCNGEKGISVYKMLNFRTGWANGLGDASKGDFSGREFVFMIRPLAKVIRAARFDTEMQLKTRVKPKDIIGIYSQKQYIDKDIRELLLNVESSLRLAQQLLQVAKYLGIEITDDVQREIFEDNNTRLLCIRQQVRKEAGFDASKIDEMRQEYKTKARLLGQKPEDIDLFASAKLDTLIGNLRSVREQEINRAAGDEAKKRVLPLILDQERFKDIHTVGDYLIYLGKKFKVPIYVDEKLYWPEN